MASPTVCEPNTELPAMYFRSFGLFQSILDDRCDAGRNLVHTGLIGMDMIRLHQLRIADHAGQNERIKRRIVTLRKIGPYRVELRRKIRSEIGRCHHPRQHDRDIAPFRLVEHRGHVGARFGRRYLPQDIVATESDQYEIRFARHIVEREREPLPPRRARIARDSGIDDFRVDAVSPQSRLHRVRQALAAVEPIARVQTVAEGQDQPLGSARSGRFHDR